MKLSSVLLLAAILGADAIAAAGARPHPDSVARRSRQHAHLKRAPRGNGFGGNFGNNGFGGSNNQNSGSGNNDDNNDDSNDQGQGQGQDQGQGNFDNNDQGNSTDDSQSGNNNNDNTGNNGNNGNNGDLQSSLQLDPSLIGPNLAEDGTASGDPGQAPSLTSTNNFINFCAGVDQPITDGTQVATGSCNPVPMGQIPAKNNVPSSKFTFPTNFGTINAGETFTISMAVQNMNTGNFVNAQTNYFSAPQQLDSSGTIIAHSHVVIEKLDALDQTTPTDPTVFAFFKGLNDPAVNGQLTAEVTGGLQAGYYKLSSINTAANHQPVLGPVAQHGSFDDAIYFTAQ